MVAPHQLGMAPIPAEQKFSDAALNQAASSLVRMGLVNVSLTDDRKIQRNSSDYADRNISYLHRGSGAPKEALKIDEQALRTLHA